MLPKNIIDLNELAFQAEERVRQEKLSRGYVSIGLVAYAVRLRVEARRAGLDWERDAVTVGSGLPPATADARLVADRLQPAAKE